MSVPRLVIAAPSSGCGKTTVATGLMAAFAARGLAVSPHKVGPDYIDPGYHALATGRAGRNLDAYLCGPELVAPLFAHGARGCDLAVVEGVMGLYDGAAGQGELASTAQVSKVLRAPVVLVVDASSQSRSVAALVHGFASWDAGVRIGGVILNKVGSARHEALLREALDEAGVPVLGVLRRAAQVETPSRHLGLVPVAERGAAAVSAVAAMGAQVAAGCDLDALMALARSAGALPGGGWSPAEALSLASHDHPSRSVERRDEGSGRPGGVTERGSGLRERPVGAVAASERPALAGAERPSASEHAAHAAGASGASEHHGISSVTGPSASERPVIAVAGGAAFTFSYAEHAELLAAAGAEVVTFDPLRDERLPEGTRGLVVGGGFPEVYAGELGANEVLREEIAALALSGAPVAAECAGLLYLCRELDGVPMCGVLDASARMGERLTLGYRDAVAVGDSVLAVAGTRMRGHEFHRTVVEPGAGPAPAWGVVAPGRRVEGFVQQGVHASYLHTHWASEPGVARRFTERCRTS
ncbi:cobyrinate a,c-diamide synthase [Streptomyces seoulensis]|uniref:Hydrogenobyrinate a,c-diamide synthase n=1 Tax=Streptomyces seoulensis TaxID=73044 RepID=A0A4P6U6Z1_STRSO|nr:cobyrinate a,c-diamide synthase [Streptomyces seoulensis]QBJ94028.1 cobyrinate a,c-diamide synthase [Streptomyces seoulensis]